MVSRDGGVGGGGTDQLAFGPSCGQHLQRHLGGLISGSADKRTFKTTVLGRNLGVLSLAAIT